MPAQKRKAADVVVVGGGCMGASIAWHLARGGADVILLEQGHVASGATGHSGGLIRRHYEHPIGIALAHESLRFFETFRARTGHDAGFVRVGFTTGARPPDVPAFERLLELQRMHHVTAETLTPAALRGLEPGMRVEDLAVGAYDARSGYADPTATALGFANAAAEAGAEVHEMVDVRRILVEQNRVTGVRTRRGEVRATKVVLAAGNWTALLAVTAGVRLPIHLVRGEVAVLRRPPDFGPPPKLHFDYYHNTYSRPDGPRDTIVGYLRSSLRTSRKTPARYIGALPEPTAKDLRARLAARFPGIARAQLRGGWTGLYDMTPDRYPILGPCGPAGLHVAAGFSGHGFKLCPAVGRIVADAVLGGPQDPSLQALTSSRFRRGRLIRPVAPFPKADSKIP